jgi:hypothetical protein
MADRNRTKGHTTINKILDRKLKIEQQTCCTPQSTFVYIDISIILAFIVKLMWKCYVLGPQKYSCASANIQNNSWQKIGYLSRYAKFYFHLIFT